MSQAIEQTGVASQNQQFNEFSYHPMPPTAPITLCLGICSLLSLVSVMGLVLCVFGVTVGAVSFLKIRRAHGELGGRTVTVIGLALSILFLISGSLFHSYAYATEVPDGYRRISFTRDISMKGFIFENGASKFSPDVEKLNGKQIFLKGYMYPVRQTQSLTEFVLVKDSRKCCFGGQPKQTDMILVTMKKPKTTDLLVGRVSVAGVFTASVPKQHANYGITSGPVYQMEAIYVAHSKTSF